MTDITVLAGVALFFMWFGAWSYNKKLIKECNKLREKNYILKAYANGLCGGSEMINDAIYKQGIEAGKQMKVREIRNEMISDSFILKNGSIASPAENFYRPSELGPRK